MDLFNDKRKKSIKNHVTGFFWTYLATVIFVTLGAVDASNAILVKEIAFQSLLNALGVWISISCIHSILMRISEIGVSVVLLGWLILVGTVGYYSFYVMTIFAGVSVPKSISPAAVGFFYALIKLGVEKSLYLSGMKKR